jgi:hypothetical protein
VETLGHLDAKKKDKSQDDFDEDEDVEVDNLFFDEMQEAEPQNMQHCDLSEMDQQNRAIVANLALAHINQDIEDYQPKIQDRSDK